MQDLKIAKKKAKFTSLKLEKDLFSLYEKNGMFFWFEKFLARIQIFSQVCPFNTIPKTFFSYFEKVSSSNLNTKFFYFLIIYFY